MTVQPDDVEILDPGPWITQPGRYDLTDDEYHGDPVVGGSLSSTGARRLLPPGCPARFHYDRTHPAPAKKEFDHGHAAHSVVLGVGAPIASLPFADRRTSAYKAAVAKARANGETPLLERDVDIVFEMAEALAAHPTAGPLLRRPGRAEQSYVARDPESGVMCRVRPDFMPDVPAGSPIIVVDYKTAADASPARFGRAAADHGYHIQGPYYLDALRWLDLTGDHPPVFVVVAQEKTPPYLVSVFTYKQRALDWGHVLARKARDVYRQCTETGHWPGYSTGPVELDIPGWLDNAYDVAELAGAYDTIGDTLR